MDARATGAAVLVALLAAAVATAAIPGAAVADVGTAGVADAGAVSVADAEPGGIGDAGAVATAADATAATGGAESQTAPEQGAVRQAVDPDAVVLRFALQPDGDADGAVEYRVRLTDDDATAAFEDLQADVRANRSAYETRFADRMGRTVASAENATGRPMALRNVTVATSRSFGGEYGVVTYRFEWIGFARTNATHLVAGDALAGLFLDGETRLLVGWPMGYRQVDAAPSPDDVRSAAVVWAGPLEFAPGEPRVVVTNSSTATATPPPTTATDTPTGAPPGDGQSGVPVVPVLAGGALLAVVAVGAWWRRRGGNGTSTEGGGEGGDGPPEELLSNEERVLRLLDQEGGRVKQQEVVSALDWTEARTSQVLGDLQEDGTVEVFRIGRENVVTLPDEEL